MPIAALLNSCALVVFAGRPLRWAIFPLDHNVVLISFSFILRCSAVAPFHVIAQSLRSLQSSKLQKMQIVWLPTSPLALASGPIHPHVLKNNVLCWVTSCYVTAPVTTFTLSAAGCDSQQQLARCGRSAAQACSPRRPRRTPSSPGAARQTSPTLCHPDRSGPRPRRCQVSQPALEQS